MKEVEEDVRIDVEKGGTVLEVCSSHTLVIDLFPFPNLVWHLPTKGSVSHPVMWIED